MIAFSFFIFPALSQAQLDNNFAGGGGIKIGDSTTTCTGNAGALRYDLDSSDGGGLQYCDGTTWTGILPSSFAGVVNNGNSFAAPMIIGTNDANSLALETNGTTRMTIDTSGNVGIGTSTPTQALEVGGVISAHTDSGTLGLIIDAGAGAADVAYQDFKLNGTLVGNLAVNAGTTGTPLEINSAVATDVSLVTGGGNVGIGTSSPASKLDVVGGASVTGTNSTTQLSVTNANTSGAITAISGVSSPGSTSGTNIGVYGEATYYSGYTGYGIKGQGNGTISYGVHGTGYAAGVYGSGVGYGVQGVSTNNGSVGVYGNATGIGASGVQGTTNNIGGFGVKGSNSTSTGYGGYFTNSNSGVGLYASSTSGYAALFPAGSVGIGTTAPLAELDVSGTGALVVPRGTSLEQPGTPANGMIRYNTDNNKFEAYENSAWTNMIGGGGTGDILNGGNTTGAAVTIGTNDAFAFNLETNNSTALTIDTSGNVGVGTATPASELHVFASASPEITLQSTATGVSGFSRMYYKNDSGIMGSITSVGSGGANNAITNVPNSFNIAAPAGATGGISLNVLETAPIRIATSNIERVRIDSSGNVGIGTTAPAVTLDVVGDVQYTGTITDVSDRRRKENIKPIRQALDTLTAVDGVSFTMKGDDSQRIEFGVIAQDVEKVLPELVHTADDEVQTKSVNYVGFIGWIIEAIKDLAHEDSETKKQISSLKKDLEVKNQKIQTLEDQMVRQQRQINELKNILQAQ